MSDQPPWEGKDRRKTPRKADHFYRIVQILNVAAWVVFVVALVVFHYARPELITGLQEYWGIDGRVDWSETLTFYLLLLLGFCLLLATCVFFMGKRRNRRKGDFFGINVYFLLIIGIVAITWILLQIN